MTVATAAIAVTLNDGTLAVMQFIVYGRGNTLPSGATWATNQDGWWIRPATPDNVAAEVRKTFHGHAERPVSWREIPASSIPTDRTYRGAWRDTGTSIVHDMPTARALHRKYLRAARAKRLASLDVEYQRADERKNTKTKAHIAKQKQRLRDLPADPRIEAAKTIDDLKYIWDDDLN